LQGSKRTLRSNEMSLPPNGLLDTELELNFALQVSSCIIMGSRIRVLWCETKLHGNCIKFTEHLHWNFAIGDYPERSTSHARTGSEGFQEVEPPIFQDNQHMKVVSLSPAAFTPPQEMFLVLTSVKGWVVRIMLIKNSSGTNGSRPRDLPACSAVPQPTAPALTPIVPVRYCKMCHVWYGHWCLKR
jgi:hypothetical protein